MPKRIKKDCLWWEARNAPIRKARGPRDCDMAEHKEGWQGAIQKGDEYLWLPHAHLNVCRLHIDPEDIEDV